jgi:hypothetical protein
MSDTIIINAIRKVTDLKVKVRPASSYFCDIEYRQIEVPPTVEVNINKIDPGIEVLRIIAITAQAHGYAVDFYNGNPFIKEYRQILRNEGFSV